MRDNFDSAIAVARCAGCLIILGYLALWGTLIAVAWHFISRYW